MGGTLPRLIRPPKQSFFLLGVRGVGKSTWVRSAYPGATVVDLLDEGLYHDLLRRPALFGEMLAPHRARDWIVVDEVQRLPALLNEVHRLIETKRLRFALLGSSARKLKASGTNLLAGRALLKVMMPLTAAELGEAFELDSVMTHGSIPLVWESDDRRATLESYVQLYLREEIRGEALVRNLPGFVRFLPIAALFHGQVVNVAGIARDAGVARTTVQGYLDILEDTLLAQRLPAYEAKLRVRERKLPKLYWVDAGLVRAVKHQLGELTVEERGALLEGWVLTNLRAHQEVAPLYDELSFWAPLQAAQTEVDFLLRRGREHLALEVKATDRYHTGLLKGLRAIAELPRVARRLLVYTGTRSFRTEDGIDVWPLKRWHDAVASGRLWP